MWLKACVQASLSPEQEGKGIIDLTKARNILQLFHIITF